MIGKLSYDSGVSVTVRFMITNRDLPNQSGIRFTAWFGLFGLTLMLLLLNLQLWFGPSSVIAFKELQQDIRVIRLESAQLHQRNHMLAEEIIELREGLDAIEERARHELGMIAQDEVFVWIVPENSPLLNMPLEK